MYLYYNNSLIIGKFSIIEKRESYNLSIRKDKLDKMLIHKRLKKTTNSTSKFHNDDNQEINYEQNLPRIFEMLKGSNDELINYAVYSLRNHLCKEDQNIEFDYMIQNGVINVLYSILERTENNLLIVYN